MPAPIGDAPDFVRHPTPRFLGKINTVAGSVSSNSGTVHASLASQALLLTWNAGAVFANLAGVNSVDVRDAAGNHWLAWQPGPPQVTIPLFIVPYFEALGNGFQVDVEWAGASPTTTELGSLYELDAAPAGWVYSPDWSKLPVDLGVTSYAPLPVEIDAANAIVTVQGTTLPVPPVGVNIQPEVTGVIKKGFSGVLGVGGTAVVVPAIAGRRIFLYHLTWGMSSGLAPAQVNGQMQDTQADPVDQIRADVFSGAGMCASPRHSTNFRGVPLSFGAGLQLKNVGNVTFDYGGVAVYTQV